MLYVSHWHFYFILNTFPESLSISSHVLKDVASKAEAENLPEYSSFLFEFYYLTRVKIFSMWVHGLAQPLQRNIIRWHCVGCWLKTHKNIEWTEKNLNNLPLFFPPHSWIGILGIYWAAKNLHQKEIVKGEFRSF